MKLLILSVVLLSVAKPVLLTNTCVWGNNLVAFLSTTKSTLPTKIKEFQAIFNFLDTNADGNVTKQEMKDMLTLYELDKADNGIYNGLNNITKDVLELDDFIKLANDAGNNDPKFWKQFRQLYKYSKIQVKSSTLIQVAKMFVPPMVLNTTKSWIKEMDEDNDGLINVHDILRCFKKKFAEINKQFEASTKVKENSITHTQ